MCGLLPRHYNRGFQFHCLCSRPPDRMNIFFYLASARALLARGVVGAVAVVATLALLGLPGGVLAQAASSAPVVSSPPTVAQPLPAAGSAAGAAGATTAPAEVAKPGVIGADYRLAPGDLLEVEVFGVSELKRTVRVDTSGRISLPLIGLIQVAGFTAADAEALIALQYGDKYLRDPQVSLFIKEFTTQRITLDGAVAKPGIYPLVGQITLLRALALAGGSAQLADLENVMLFRITPEGVSEQQKHDVLKIRQGEAPDPMLQGEDVVVVNRDSTRTVLRDSLFRDIIDTLNPFSNSVRNINSP